jgi:hypothetical protein
MQQEGFVGSGEWELEKFIFKKVNPISATSPRVRISGFWMRSRFGTDNPIRMSTVAVHTFLAR